MSDLQIRAEQLRAAGRRTAYAIGYATVADAAHATHLQIYLGPQWSGAFLYLIDLDSHHAGQDANAALAAFRHARPELAAKLDFHRSQSGKGYHALFESHKQLDTGKLYDVDGNHIGELLGKEGERTPDPGDVRIPCLLVGQLERLSDVWHVTCSDSKGKRWGERAKQGERWTRGYTRRRASRADLRTFLDKMCGHVGKTLAILLDARPRDRSAAAGSLMQTLMLFAHKLPCGRESSFEEKCQWVMAYWMASDSFGKALDKDYNQERDGCSLLAQIVAGDPFGDDRHWIAPFWTKSNTSTVAVSSEPQPAPRRPAHRPAGDQEKQIARLKRLLERRAFEGYGDRLSYNTDDLADYLGVKRRAIQYYLAVLAGGDHPQIKRGQVGGRGGQAWLTLTPAFWGANNAEARIEKADQSADSRGANASTDERTTMPQTADSPPNAKEDHQDPSAPAPGAFYDRHADWTAGGALAAWRNPSTLRVPDEPIDRRAPARPGRPAPRIKGQLSFTRIDGALKKRIAARPSGPLPAAIVVTPRARMPVETLPDLDAPAGAHGTGASLPAPAGAAIGIVERLKAARASAECST